MHDGTYHNDGMGEATGWSAFVDGALMGAGVALLFAPQSGSELRGMLRDYVNRAKDDLVEKAEEVWNIAEERGKEYYDKGDEAIRDVGRSAREFAKQGQEVAQDAGRSAKELVKQGKYAVEETANEMSKSCG
jgi:gas vesicle protein